MRILVYLDTPRQRSYVASIQGLEDVCVYAGGPGVAEGYFELADDDRSLDTKAPRLAPTTRIRLAFRNVRVRWHTGYHRFLKATQLERKKLRALFQSRRRGTRPTERPRAGWTWSALRPATLALQQAAEAVRVVGLRGRAKAARALKTIRPIRLVQKRHQRQILKLPRLLQAPAMFLSAVTLAIAAVATIALNSAGIAHQLLQRRVYLNEAARLIERARPQVIVVMEDNAEGLTGVMTFAARRAGIPFIVLPDYIPNPMEPATYYGKSRAHHIRTLLDWLVATGYPKWTYAHNGRIMIRLPAATVLAYQLLRCDPPAPWILNSGYAHAIALDSTAMWAHYRDLGFRQGKLRVIGTAQDDRLHARFLQRASLRAELMSELALTADQPIVLCAFPPDQYVNADAGTFEYETYADLVRAWFAELAGISGKANVIVRPHPRTVRGLLEQACPPGVHVVWTPTEDLIPICDLYVASVSTTIRWALGLGLPVLNYDCYRYGYGDFATAGGVLECTDRSAFAANLQDLAGGGSELAAKARADREAWGQVDGKYAERVRHLLGEAAKDVSKAQPTHDVSTVPGARLIRTALAQLRLQR